MDILTLTLVDAVFRERSVRKAARSTGRAPSTVSSALARMESAVAVPLVRRQGTVFILTLEAEWRLPLLTLMVADIHALLQATSPGRTDVPQINIAALARFSAVAHRGSIRGAARKLGMGQPQLTRQLGDLERHLGAPLLERSAAGVTLSKIGRAALPSAEAIIAGWESLTHAASDRFRRDVNSWRLGSVNPLGHESSIAQMLSNLTASWAGEQARHPLLISSHTADELMLGLKTRRFDLVIIDHTSIPDDFFWAQVSSAPLALVGDASIMAAAPTIPDLLRNHPLVLPSPQSGIRQEAMRFLDKALGREAASLRITEVDSIPVIINLVAVHGYVSVLPQPSLVRLPFSLRHISLAPDHMQKLVLAWRHSGLPERLLEAVKRSVLSAEASVFK